MDATVKRYYDKLRKRGWLARVALESAKVQADFDALGEECVRVRIEPDDGTDMDFLKGDTFNRHVNPDIQESRMAREEKAFEDRVNRLGVWGFIAEFCDPRTGEWECANSCWGFVGEDDAFESGYAYDGMAEAIAKYREALAASRRFSVQAGRGILRDGVHVVSIHLQESASARFAMPPHECDRLTRRIAFLLNTHGEDGEVLES